MTSDCPKCGGRMAEGFVGDQTYGATTVSSWYAGPPRESFWTGLKLKLKGVENQPIVT